MRQVRFRAVEQRLASGVTIRQDFRRSVRMVMFDTGFEAWRYSTFGGTAFVVLFEGKPYALTCQHVRKDFEWDGLIITDTRDTQLVAPLQATFHATKPTGAAAESDILDITLVEFYPGVDTAFFKDSAYLLDPQTVGTSQLGDPLLVAGSLKEKSIITETTYDPGYCLLEFQDAGAPLRDVTLRRAIAEFEAPEFTTIAGLSGSPVFNRRAKALSGMALRGTLDKTRCVLWYIDIIDMIQMLAAVHEGRTETAYTKRLQGPRPAD
jgi:hypothetical protein